MKKIITTIVILLALIIGGFFYITRAPSAPSTDINSAGQSDALTAVSDQKLFRISGEKSLARFDIDEILNDKPFTAIGTTTQIAGDILVKDSKTIEIGTIRINARTFKTDNERRDGAIVRAILKSESPENEFIEFKPTSISLVSGSFAENDLGTFKVEGDLKISGITKKVSFDGILENKGTEISGAVHSTIKRSDFGLVVPSLPFIASVDDDFKVSATITAIMTTTATPAQSDDNSSR